MKKNLPLLGSIVALSSLIFILALHDGVIVISIKFDPSIMLDSIWGMIRWTISAMIGAFIGIYLKSLFKRGT